MHTPGAVNLQRLPFPVPQLAFIGRRFPTMVFLDRLVAASPQLAGGPASAFQRAENQAIDEDEYEKDDNQRNRAICKAPKRRDVQRLSSPANRRQRGDG